MNPEQALHVFAELLDICKDKVIAVINGNHEERTKRRVGVDLLSVLCKERNITYSQDIAVIDIQVGTHARIRGSKRIQYTIVCGHGYTAARTIGGKITANGRLVDVVVNGDIYLTAHTHQPSIVKISRLEADTRNKKIMEREAFLITVPSWVGYEHYAAKKFMHPSAGGHIEIMLSGLKKNVQITVK